MKPIVTFTLNPSIDGSSEAAEVRPVNKIRTSNERYDPGGGGINVSRVVRELGGETLAIYLAGGATGSVLDSLIDARGVPRFRIDVHDDTRVSHTVFERSSGLEYRFVPEGPLLRDNECSRALAALREHDYDWLVASGSLPRGAAASFYARMVEIARARGARVVLDTSGEALRVAVDAGGLTLAKPSFGEFRALVGSDFAAPADLEREAMALVESGKIEILAVTLGHEGALLATREGPMRLPALPVEARSAVGAGDSFVAAMTLALAQGRTAREAFIRGVAAGTAAVLTAGTELCRRADVDRLTLEATEAARRAGY
jgi:6-phosphofructokinase 2